MRRGISIVIAAFLGFAGIVLPAWGQDKCHVLRFLAPDTAKVWQINVPLIKLGMHFEVDAEFDSAPPAVCKCCEYRQELKGETFIDGNPVIIKLLKEASGPHPPGTIPPLVETYLNKDTYNEDYRDYGDGNGPNRYGHRDESTRAVEKYTKGGTGPNANTEDRQNGCHYHMTDEPGFGGFDPRHAYKLDWTFRMSIVSYNCEGGCDGCQSIEFPVKVEWTPPPPSAAPATPAPPTTPAAGSEVSLAVLLVLLAFWGLYRFYRRRRTARLEE